MKLKALKCTFTKAQIVSVTSRCYSDLLTVVEHELANLRHRLAMEGIKQDLIAGIVLTGGGSQMEDIVKCATNIFGSHVRIGYPLNITGLTDYVNKPQYATVIGLLQYSHLNTDDSVSYGLGHGSEESVFGVVAKGLKNFFNKVRSEF